jgi:hypothetical protein
MPKNAKKSIRIKGITPMYLEDHSFEGFAVRRIVRGTHFRQYVSASAQNYPELGNRESRRAAAFTKAKELKAGLDGVLDEAGSFRKGELTKASARKIMDLGFRIV